MLNLSRTVDACSNIDLSTNEIRNRLLSRLENVLQYLLPNGKRYHHEYRIGNVSGDSGDSLKIELQGPKAGMWNDFATGEGGDIFNLWAKVRGMDAKNDFPRLVEDMQNWLGLHIAPTKNEYQSMERKPPANDDLGEPTAKWNYTDRDGKIMTTVFRYDPKNKSKQFRPYDAIEKVFKVTPIIKTENCFV